MTNLYKYRFVIFFVRIKIRENLTHHLSLYYNIINENLGGVYETK